MVVRKEDEIMAESLLKGGKMLEKSCKTCGCPLFEVKGKTLCVVCAENGPAKDAKNAKTGNRGVTMMFVGYPDNREHDSVCMWNPETNGVWTTRDVIWLKRYYFDRNHGEATEEETKTEIEEVIEEEEFEEAELEFAADEVRKNSKVC